MQFQVACSFVEIYMETIADLLAEKGSKEQLQIREDREKGIYVDGATEKARL